MRKAQWTALLAPALAATLLTGTGTARADWQTDRAQAIAAKVWNDPCAGHVTLGYATPPSTDWRAWTFTATCTILLSDQPPAWRWTELCPVLMHEYGHLAGYTDPLNPSDPTHSHDPDSIMWPYEHYDARCDGYGARYLGLVAAPTKPAKRHRVVRRRRHARRAGAAVAQRLAVQAYSAGTHQL
jgi:hypothetical protein